jgi:hypothetical protein
MEGLARLVSDSLARQGFNPPVDYRRLQWSKWFRCDSSFSLLLVPSQPGLFALGEELIAPGEVPATGGKRMLGVFRIAEAQDLGLALGRLFLPGHPDRERVTNGRCFARYAMIEDPVHRRAASTALEHWLASAAEIAGGTATEFPQPGEAATAMSTQAAASEESRSSDAIHSPAPLPSGF